MLFGFKVSRPGKDVSSTNPQDFVFNSELGSVKIVQQPPNKTAESVEVNGSSTLNKVIAHNLGFVPLCLVFAERTPGSGRYYFGVCYDGPEDRTTPVDVVGGVANTYADTNNLTIKFLNNSGSNQTVNLYYFIMGDSAT